MVSAGSEGAGWPGRADDPPRRLSVAAMNETTTDDFADLEARVRRIVSRWGHDPTGLVQILREVQEDCGTCRPRPSA